MQRPNNESRKRETLELEKRVKELEEQMELVLEKLKQRDENDKF